MNNQKIEFKNEDTINFVFTPGNTQGIVELLNYLSPRETTRVKDSEYETIIAAAKADALQGLIVAVMNFSINNNN